MSKTVRSAEWLEDKGLLQFRGKIYVPRNPDLRRRMVSLCRDTKVAGYPRCWKTLELVSRNYWWPQMSRYIEQYISTCDLCLRTKPIRQAPVGELHPLWILDSQWDMLSMNFVVELLLSSRHDTVMTVVDSVLKRAHNSDSRKSSQAFPTSSLKAPWPSEVCNLGPWTSVCSSFHQRTLLSTRNKVGIFYCLAPSN